MRKAMLLISGCLLVLACKKDKNTAHPDVRGNWQSVRISDYSGQSDNTHYKLQIGDNSYQTFKDDTLKDATTYKLDTLKGGNSNSQLCFRFADGSVSAIYFQHDSMWIGPAPTVADGRSVLYIHL